MSAEAGRQFVDTNILVYGYDLTAGDKHLLAKRLLDKLWSDSTGCLSTQVLQEFYVTVTRKVRQPLPPETASRHVEDLGQWLTHSPTIRDLIEAIHLQQQSKLSFWDAMLVTSAKQLDCEILWTEDMNRGQTLGGVKIQNPLSEPLNS